MFGIKINNFRSFSNQFFDFSRVNILIGENSSGKSSLTKFLLFLKQSIAQQSKSFRFSSELGNYSDFVYLHNSDLEISFEFELKDEYITFFKSELSSKKEFEKISEEISSLKEEDKIVKLLFSFDKNTSLTNEVKTTIENSHFGKLELIRLPSKDSIIQGSMCKTIFYSKKRESEIIFEEVSFSQYGFTSLTSGSFIKSKLKDDKKDEYIFYEMAFLLISQNYIHHLLSIMSYVNPISSSPERSYDENNKKGMLYKTKDIKDVVNILSDDTLEKTVIDTLLNKLNDSLRFYGILHEVKVIDSGFGAKELKVKINKDGIWSNIKDVGYGSSLQIPIIFQAIVSDYSGGEIIIIEQPELHIHPLLQSKFIETLVSISDKNTYIIETHSPDVIRKLQVLIKKELFNLNQKDVNIFYFKKDKNDSKVSFHQINENGKLSPRFPSGFFDSSVQLVKELF